MLAGLAGLGWAVTASGTDDSLSACRDISEDAARLACYDTLARNLPPTPVELFGRDAIQSEDIVLRAAGIEQIDEIRARVTGVRLDPYGKLILTLDNGQVWSQIDSPALSLKSGDEVRIRRAAMGSYLLAEVDSKRSSRVRRSQ